MKKILVAVSVVLFLGGCNNTITGNTINADQTTESDLCSFDTVTVGGAEHSFSVLVADYDMDGDGCLSESENSNAYNTEIGKIDGRTVKGDVVSDIDDKFIFSYFNLIGNANFVTKVGGTRVAQLHTNMLDGKFVIEFASKYKGPLLADGEFIRIGFNSENSTDFLAGGVGAMPPHVRIDKEHTSVSSYGHKVTLYCTYKDNYNYSCQSSQNGSSIHVSDNSSYFVLPENPPTSAFLIAIVCTENADKSIDACLNNHASLSVSLN